VGSPGRTDAADPEGTHMVDLSMGALEPFYAEPDLDLALGAIERGRAVYTGWWLGVKLRGTLATMTGKELIDGKAKAIANTFQVYMPPGQRGWSTNCLVDLGEPFFVREIRFYTRILREGPDLSKFPEGYVLSSNYLRSYTVYVTDGTVDRYGWFVWKELERNPANNSPFVSIKMSPPRLVRAVLLETPVQESWEIAELEVFGDGYVREAEYLTKLIDVSELTSGALKRASWGRIGWGGRGVHDPEAKIFIRTRTGEDDTPYLYWKKTGYGDIVPFDEDGRFYTKGDYERFPVADRAGVTEDYEDWNPWSAFYPFEEGLGGVRITSPGPRRYIQLKVRFLPSRTDGGHIDSLWIEFSEPAAGYGVVAELDTDMVQLGGEAELIYALRGKFEEGDPGYDRLRVGTPHRAEVLDVWVEDERGDTLARGRVISTDDDNFVVGLGERIRREDRLLKVRFKVPVLRYGVEFPGWVWADGEEMVEQRVDPGDAQPGWGSDVLVVRTGRWRGRVIGEVSAAPRAFTPNGDDVSDEVSISCTLLQLTSPTEVRVEVCDLSGRSVRLVFSGRCENGTYRWTWDGRDEHGDLVPPGVYLYRLEVRADEGREERVGTIVVAY